MWQRDTDGIEFRKRSAAFEREHRDALFAHEVDQVDRRQKRALSSEMLGRVHRVHEDADRLVRLPELVGVRVDHAIVEVRTFLARASPFVVEIARRSLNARKQRAQAAATSRSCIPLDIPLICITAGAALIQSS